MESVVQPTGVVDIQGDGQDRPVSLPFIFSPGDHRGQIGAAVEDVHVEAAVPDPGQARHIKGVGRHVRQVEVVQGGVPCPILRKRRWKVSRSEEKGVTSFAKVSLSGWKWA